MTLFRCNEIYLHMCSWYRQVFHADTKSSLEASTRARETLSNADGNLLTIARVSDLHFEIMITVSVAMITFLIALSQHVLF